MNIDRRTAIKIGGLTTAKLAFGAGRGDARAAEAGAGAAFPLGFLWGAATAGHQIEGNNVSSDLWLLERMQPTIFAEPSGDADNSLELWATDLDLVKSIGLDSYRFSLEWARIEPAEGAFSLAMLDHYKAIIDGCRARALMPVVTFNHFTTPRWFAARGGWTRPDSPALFARFCDRAARHLAEGIAYATTLNEPNGTIIARSVIPPQMVGVMRTMLAAAAAHCGTASYSAGNVADPKDADVITENLLAGHKAGRLAIKAAKPNLPVGVSLAVSDDQEAGPHSRRDAMRTLLYGQWLDAARGDDFIGVQNYDRKRWDAHGLVPDADTKPGDAGGQVSATSLGAAVRYVHGVTGLPILVTEHGINSEDDHRRAELIPIALHGLRQAMQDGVPVLGYMHWSLMDNFEWVFGMARHYGLCSVDRQSFARLPKPSAHVLGVIARQNSL